MEADETDLNFVQDGCVILPSRAEPVPIVREGDPPNLIRMVLQDVSGD